ncbi:MAG: hypothetical protein ACRD5Z_25675, partial [Bryobacteraceae bacterium]
MKKIIRAAMVAFFTLSCMDSNAFETATHYDMSMFAAKLAMTDEVMRKVGRLPVGFNEQMPASPMLDFHKEFTYPLRPCTHWNSYIATNLIGCGAIFEDFTFLERPIFHFLDPQHIESTGYGAP